MVRQDFINYIAREKRYSKHTIISYETDLKQFQEFLVAQYQIDDIRNADHYAVRSWLVFLFQNKKSVNSINRKISCLKSFYKYLFREGLTNKNPMLKVSSPKSGSKVPEFVKEKDMETLLQNTDFGNDFEGVRNKLIIEAFYSTGVRISELINIRIQDINLEEKTVKILGKRNKERLTPLSAYLVNSIENYLLVRSNICTEKETTSRYLFITKQGKQTYSKLVYRIINKYLSYVSSNTKKSPHTLRHSFATIMLNKGAELNSIKEILGHSSLAATQIYTHNSIEKLKIIYKQAHPRA